MSIDNPYDTIPSVVLTPDSRLLVPLVPLTRDPRNMAKKSVTRTSRKFARSPKVTTHPAYVDPEDESQDVPDEEVAKVIDADFEMESPETTPEPAQATAASTSSSPSLSSPISMTDAARLTINAGHTKPANAVAYILATFGLNMTGQSFSQIKMRLKKESEGGKASGKASGKMSGKTEATTATTAVTKPPKGKPGRKPKVIEAGKTAEAWPCETLPPMTMSFIAPKATVASPALSTSSPDLLDAAETLKSLVGSLGVEKVRRIVDLLG